MIVRPSPFICAEWEFGGLPAWLLEEDLRIRSSDPAFIEAVDRYYDRLLGLLTPYQVDRGGPILMMQVEMSTALMEKTRIIFVPFGI